MSFSEHQMAYRPK